jgi:hypothetical protein
LIFFDLFVNEIVFDGSAMKDFSQTAPPLQKSASARNIPGSKCDAWQFAILARSCVAMSSFATLCVMPLTIE